MTNEITLKGLFHSEQSARVEAGSMRYMRQVIKCVVYFALLVDTLAVFATGNTTRVTFINSLTNEKIGEYEYPQYAQYSEAKLWGKPVEIYDLAYEVPNAHDTQIGWVDAKTGKYVHGYDMVDGTVTELKSARWPVKIGKRYYNVSRHVDIKLVPKGEETPSNINDPDLGVIMSSNNTTVYKLSRFSDDPGYDNTGVAIGKERALSNDANFDPYALNEAISKLPAERDIVGISVWTTLKLDSYDGVHHYYYEDGRIVMETDDGDFSGVVNLVTYAPNGVFSRKTIYNVNLVKGDDKKVFVRHFIPIEELELGGDYDFYVEVVSSDSNETEPIGKWYGMSCLYLNMFVWDIAVSVHSADVAKGEIELAWKSQNEHENLSDKVFSVWRSSGLVQDGRSIRGETVRCIKTEVTGTNFTDNTFGDIPGTDIVRYWIVRRGAVRWRDNDHPKLAYSVDTRRRVCLSVGLDEYEREQSINGPKGHEHDAKEAELFANLISKGGGLLEDNNLPYISDAITCLDGYKARPISFVNAFTRLADKCQPGDVFFFYIATHGVASSGDASFIQPTFALYAEPNSEDAFRKKGYFMASDMAGLLRKTNLKNKGVKFIGVDNTCYSGDFVEYFKDDDEFNNTAWIASTVAGKVSPCGDLYSRFGVVFLGWGWRDMEAKRDTIYLKDGFEMTVPKNDDRQLDLLEIARYSRHFLDHGTSPESETPLSYQQMTLVNPHLLSRTDVVDLVDDNVKFSRRSPSPRFQISEDGRCMRFTPIMADTDCVPDRFVVADFVPENGGNISSLCYCPYPDEYKIKRSYLLFTKDQAQYYMNSEAGIEGFVKEYNNSRFFVDPSNLWLEPGTMYECRAWTISPAGWSNESFPEVFETMGFWTFMWTLLQGERVSYKGDGERIISWSPSLLGNRRATFLAAKGDDKVRVTISPSVIYPTDYDYDYYDDDDDNDDSGDDEHDGDVRVFFDAEVEDSEGRIYCYRSENAIYESSLMDEDEIPVFELYFPSSMEDMGDMKVTLKGLEMYGTVGAFSFTGFAYAPGYDFKDDEFVYWDETLHSEEFSYEPELTVTPPEINEEDLVFTIKFDACGGKTPVSEITAKYGEKYGDRLPVPTRNGYRFDGWFTKRYASAYYYTPIVSDSMVVAGGTLYASWFYTGPDDGDQPVQEEDIVDLDEVYGPFVPGVVYTNDFSEILPSYCKVTGLPSGMKWDSKMCSVIGAATKPSTNVVSFTYTETDWYYNQKVVYSGSAIFIVGPFPVLSVESVGGDSKCKVSGMGAFAAGAKIAPSATASKEFVFVGWFTDLACTLPYTEGGTDWRETKYIGKMPSVDLSLYAKFTTKAEDSASLKVTVTNATTATDGGYTLDLGSFVTSLSQPKLTVKGLPSGLKFDAKTGLVSGKATKPGVYTVTVTATNASATGKDAATCEFTLTVPNLTDEAIPVADGYGPFIPGVGYAETVAAAAGCTVTGLPSGMKWTAKDVVDAKTKTVEVPANSFYGAATKPGSYTVYFTKTVAKAKHTATATFTVGPFPKLTVEMSGNTGKDKVAGAGDYAANKKVTLKATPDKGKVFAGWYDAEGEPLVGAADHRTASFPYVATDADVTLRAVFATAAEDAVSLKVSLKDDSTASDGTYELALGPCVESISIPKLAVKGLPSGLKYDAKTLTIRGKATKPGVYAVKVEATNSSVKKATADSTGEFTLMVPNFESGKMPGLKYSTDAYGVLPAGVALDPNLIDCAPAEGWTVKASGLPAGLKYDAKTGVISGILTDKAGSYTVTFTVTKGSEKETATITLNVSALPVWAVGTFDGSVCGGGIVQGLTVAANGKISGKILEGGQTWTLSATSFDFYDVDDDAYLATVVGKVGKAAVTNEIEVVGEDGVGVVSGWTALDPSGQPAWLAFQNLWKRADTKAAQPVFKKNIDVSLDNGLKLTFKKDGVVAFAGTFGDAKVSGSSQLVWSGGWSVTLYAPPKGTFAGFCETYAVTLTFEDADPNVVKAVAVAPVDE